MIKPDNMIGDLLRVAEGEIVGRIRLQKIVYLLEQKGLGAEITFQYYHYGPYARVVDAAIERGKAFAGIKEEIKYRLSDGAPFSVFHVDDRTAPENLGCLSFKEAKSLVAAMKNCSSTVIELAATIHWLAFHEKVEDWRRELIRRKGAKTEGGRLEQAESLLQTLQLAPVAAA